MLTNFSPSSLSTKLPELTLLVLLLNLILLVFGIGFCNKFLIFKSDSENKNLQIYYRSLLITYVKLKK